MHKTQQLIVFVGLALVVGMVLFPPWVFVDEQRTSHPMGYAPLWKPPVDRQKNTADIFGIKLELNTQTKTANTIDLPRLLMQFMMVFAVAGGAVFMLRKTA